jgi:cyclic pyranopterin phosphate synthase
MLANELPGVDLTLTTNGSALKAKARALKAAGLTRITVSLDSLDDATFRTMNAVDFPVAKVLEAIDAAAGEGLAPVKINMVVKRGVNDRHIVDMARHFKGSGNIVRFIEFMDVGATNGWKMDNVIPSAEVVRAINEVFACEPANPITSVKLPSVGVTKMAPASSASSPASPRLSVAPAPRAALQRWCNLHVPIRAAGS